MRASLALDIPPATVRPGHRFVPERPYVYAFALADPPTGGEQIVLGEPVTVVVADGTRQPHDPHDWFTARLPAIPPVSGPMQIGGVEPGDTLHVEVLAIDEGERMQALPRVLTVTAPMVPGAGTGPVQVAIPVGGLARLPVHRRGGSLSFGPVMARNGGDDAWIAVAATVTLRCTRVSCWGG